MTNRLYEDTLLATIKREFKTVTKFVEEACQFDVLLTDGMVRGRLRTESKGFDEEQKARIAAFLRSKGINPPEIGKGRGRVVPSQQEGLYLFLFNLERDPPEGHSDLLHGRFVELSATDADNHSFRSLEYDNNRYNGRQYVGTIKVLAGSTPSSLLLIMDEEDRTAAPAAFLMINMFVDGSPILYGSAVGFNGDRIGEVVSTRALGLPAKWFPSNLNTCISPEEIGSAFAIIAAYLRQEVRNEKGVTITDPILSRPNAKDKDLSIICRDVRDSLIAFEKSGK